VLSVVQIIINIQFLTTTLFMLIP